MREPVVIVAVYCEFAASSAAGAKIAVFPEYETVPRTAPPGPVTARVDALIVAGSITSLKLAVITAVVKMPVAPFAGDTVVTAGPRTNACSRPQPATMLVSKKAKIRIL